MIAIAAKNPIGHMASKEPKVTLSASVEPHYKERFEAIAKQKRWTLSQTVQYFIEENLEYWEDQLDISRPKAKQAEKSKP